MADVGAEEQDLAGDGRQAPRDRLHELGAPRAHEAVDADDLAGANGQVEPVHGICDPGGSADRQPPDDQGGLPFLAVRRRAQVVILADHVADDPFQIDVRARRMGRDLAIAQHDRMVGDGQRFFQMVRDIDDRDALRLQIADHLEQHRHLRRRQGRGGLVHDQDARIDRQGPRDLDQLLLAQPQVLDARQRVNVLFQLLHQRAGLALLLGIVDARRARDLAPHEDIVAHVHVRRQGQFLVDDGNAEVPRGDGRADRRGPALQQQFARCRLLDARQDLHQRRFSRAVLAEQRGHLAAMHVEIDALERMHRAEGLGHVAGRKNDLGGTRLRPVNVGSDAPDHHRTSSRTGVTSQFFGLIMVKAPVTEIVRPGSASRSSPDRTAAAMARLIPAPAS